MYHKPILPASLARVDTMWIVENGVVVMDVVSW